MKKIDSYHIFSGFILKILGAFFMTLDHIGIFLSTNENTFLISSIFRSFGRLALPIFLFLISEGIRYTRNEKKYLLRLGLLATSFLIGQLFLYYVLTNQSSAFTSPMTDLFFSALLLILLKRKDKFSWFSLLIISYSILCFVVTNYEWLSYKTIKWLPFYLRLDYPLFSTLLSIGFYYAKSISVFYIKNVLNSEELIDTPYQRYAQYFIAGFSAVVISLVFYVIFISTKVSYSKATQQAWAAASFIPIFLYSGERGYNKTWFKYACYFYIPTHLVLIYLIFSLI